MQGARGGEGAFGAARGRAGTGRGFEGVGDSEGLEEAFSREGMSSQDASSEIGLKLGVNEK